MIVALYDVRAMAGHDNANGVALRVIGGRGDSHHGHTARSLMPAIVARRARGRDWDDAPGRAHYGRESYVYRLTAHGVSCAITIKLARLPKISAAGLAMIGAD